MTEIRVGTPGENSQSHSYRANIQMQGFAAGAGAGDGGQGGRHIPTGPFGSARTNKDPGAGANPEVKFRPSSVHSEPDLDTIMPLPPGSYTPRAHHHSPATFRISSGPDRGHGPGRVRAGSGVGVGGGGGHHGTNAVRIARTGSINKDAEESGESSEEEIDLKTMLPHSPRSIGFTNVEVSKIILTFIYFSLFDSYDNP